MSINHTYNRETFIDREVALALFDCVLGRNPDQPWPLLPILTFIAPSGGGKRTLIECLCREKCSLSNDHAAMPYVDLDFTPTQTPFTPTQTPLEILCDIRNQLQSHSDGNGKDCHLTFPHHH